MLNLPKRVINRTRHEDQGVAREALRVQWAVAVEILLMAPMRLKNLVGLHIDHHIQRTRASDGIVHLVIPGVEVKNGDPLDYCLPQETTELLDIYLRDFRPRLCAPDNPWLFPGQAPDKSKSEHTLSIQIKNYIQRETDLEVHVHLFRHFAAKLFLDQNPGIVRDELRSLEARGRDLEWTLGASLEDSSVEVHPNIGKLYAKKVGELRVLLTDDTTRPQAMDMIRSMIERGEVTEGVERSTPDVILVGDLAAILAYTQNNTATLISENGGRVLMVAGVGFEPTTFRL